jgi:hypothetical protein
MGNMLSGTNLLNRGFIYQTILEMFFGILYVTLMQKNLNLKREIKKRMIIIKNVHIERGVSKMLDAEAVRVVKSMPKWNPAFDGKGKPVPFSHFIPINFRLK